MALTPNTQTPSSPVQRIRVWYGVFLLIIGIFGLRLFYVQIIRYDHYKKAALSDQLKQYQIPAARGEIEAHDGSGGVVPIVLNQQLYTLYADPTFIKNAQKVAGQVASVIGGQASDYVDKLKTPNTRYVVLAKKISSMQQAKIAGLKDPGLGTIEQDYRTYPQGELASQLLGFVNDNGQGEYGIEQALNKQLSGTPGELKAITDASGVPLAASKDNTQVAPKNGANVVLTIDLAMQQALEGFVKKETQHSKGTIGSAVVLDPYTGAIKAMANFPTYDPAHYYNVSDPSVFANAAVSDPIEPGSIMKVLTTAAALNQGVVQPDTTYYDPAHWTIDGFTIKNIEEDGGPGVKSLPVLLNLSLNTGATWELMQMGGGQIDTQARNVWYNYMTKHYMLGKPTGVEQGYEAGGYVPPPQDNGAAIDLTYANTSFGQAVTATPLQMAAALASVMNGGTYYKPRLVDQMIDSNGNTTTVKPKVEAHNVVKSNIWSELVPMMQYVVEHHPFYPQFDQTHYIVGGKTGTAQVAQPGGGYYDNKFNGTYYGFVGGNKPQYIIVAFVQFPSIPGYAGTVASEPIFGDMAHWLIDDGYVTPKSQ